MPSIIRSLADFPYALAHHLFSPRPRTATSDLSLVGRVDWRAVASEANRHGVGMLLYSRLEEAEALGSLSPELEDAWSTDTRHSQLQCQLQFRDAVEISRAFSRRGVVHAFFKGFPLRELLYSPRWTRPAADLDILIDRRDIEVARRLMYDIGFVHASRSSDFTNFRIATRAEVERVEARHYELAQFARSWRLTNPPPWLFEPSFAPHALHFREDCHRTRPTFRGRYSLGTSLSVQRRYAT